MNKEGFENPISVSDYILFLNEILKKVKVKVVGEVSQLKIHGPSGHVYFTLKDKNGGGVINCVVWKSIYRMFGESLKEGMEIILSGKSDIYAPRGSLAFKVESFELVGEGALKKAYDELKIKLTKEGIFSQNKKRPIPDHPEKIGVITSLRSGTVIHDFTSNLKKFGFKIVAIDSRVEGQEAVRELIASVKSFRKKDIDALVIIRGGGSLESLMAFDNEMLVREIAKFPVPVIAGIGHHKDVTLVSLAADIAESTPSAVAYLLNRPWEVIDNKIEIDKKSILYNFESTINSLKNKINISLSSISKLFEYIFNQYKKIENSVLFASTKIGRQISKDENLIKERHRLIIKLFSVGIRDKKTELMSDWNNLRDLFILLSEEKSRKLLEFQKIISQNNPKRQLKMGYSITRINGKIARSVYSFEKNDILKTELFDGEVESEIKKINK